MLESKNKVQANIVKSVEGGGPSPPTVPNTMQDSNERFAKVTQQASMWEQVRIIFSCVLSLH